jgi:glycosyltransferase involved in cell wall biosynthesis
MLFPRRKVMQILTLFKPDIIHTHEALQCGTLTRIFAKRSNLPSILTIHQLPWFVASYLPGWFRPAAEASLWAYARMTLKKYTNLVVPTQTIADIIEKRTGNKPHVIGFGLDLQKFHPPDLPDLSTVGSGRRDGIALRKELSLPVDCHLFLHVGRLDADKGVDKLIRASTAAILKSEAHLLVVGDGRRRESLQKLCIKLNIQRNVHFTGFAAMSQLPRIYRAADVFITASELETQGIVLLEAAASGLPIVAVDATCISEVVRDGENGFLIRPNDHASFSEALVKLLSDRKLSQAMGAQGRIQSKNHDKERIWNRHEDLYFEMAPQLRNEKIDQIPPGFIQKKDERSLIWPE